jgi:hypothetical protein
MSFLIPLIASSLISGVMQNVQNKSANQNQQNSMNNALSITGQNQQKAQSGLNQWNNNNPFAKMQAPQAPQQVGAGASMQAPPPPGQPGQGGQQGIPPALLQALQAAMSGQGGATAIPGGQPPQQGGGMRFPQATQSQGAPTQNLQSILSQFYGQR